MNKYFASIFACIAAWTSATADDFVITGNVPAVPDSAVVMLFQIDGRSGESIAQDTVINGKFRLSAPLKEGVTKADLDLFIGGMSNKTRELYLRPGAQVEINADDRYVHTWPVKSNVPEQAEYDNFINRSRHILNTIQQKNIDLQQALPTVPDKDRKTLISTYKAESDSLEVAVSLNNLDILQHSPVSPVWLDKLNDVAFAYSFYKPYSDILEEPLKKLYNNLDDSYKKTTQGLRTQVYLYPPSKIEVGDLMPETVFKDIDGHDHTLAEMRGKWVLLDFWVRGCYACIMAIPELHEFGEKNAEVAEVVSLSLDTEKTWHEATEQFNVKGNNWNEGKEDLGIFQKFGAEGTPTFVLISPEGIVKSKWMAYTQGHFDRELKLQLKHSENKTEYLEDTAGVRVIRQPEYSTNTTYAILDIDSIELSDEGTKIHFSFNFTPGWWISISPDAYLTVETGSKLHITGSEGITPGKELYADENGTGSFTITFEPLSGDPENVSFYEGENSDWSIRNIRLKP